MLSVPVKEFWKSNDCWRRLWQKTAYFFAPPSIWDYFWWEIGNIHRRQKPENGRSLCRVIRWCRVSWWMRHPRSTSSSNNSRHVHSYEISSGTQPSTSAATNRRAHYTLLLTHASDNVWVIGSQPSSTTRIYDSIRVQDAGCCCCCCYFTHHCQFTHDFAMGVQLSCLPSPRFLLSLKDPDLIRIAVKS